MKKYGEDADTAIVEGKVTHWKQDATTGRDKYIVEWEGGRQENLRLAQVRRLIQSNPGTTVTALPSSVRLLTAAFCCSENHRLRRGRPIWGKVSRRCQRRRRNQRSWTRHNDSTIKTIKKVRSPRCTLSAHSEISPYARHLTLAHIHNY